MRTAKAVTKGTTTDNYKYIYENGLLMQMRCNNIILDFTYGSNGRPIGFAYRASAASTPSYYYYALNSRGDVVGLYNSSGALIVNYKYDAYGKLLGITNSSGSAITAKYSYGVLNPLRYRGYVYDTETGFYYLQTRYYDPTTCRFVNADSQLNTDSFTGFNQFAYCENNPIMHIDPIGTRTFECCPYGDCPYCKSCTPIKPSAPDEAYCYIAPDERFTIVNHVSRTSATSPELMLDFGWHIGKFGTSTTEYINKGKKPGLFHSFAESGSDSCEGGVGININDWLAVDVGGRYNYEGFCNVNVYTDIQITPWINFENSIGTDGYGRLLGITIDDIRTNFELKTGWFAFAYAYAFAVAPDVAVSAVRTYGPSYSYAYSY